MSISRSDTLRIACRGGGRPAYGACLPRIRLVAALLLAAGGPLPAQFSLDPDPFSPDEVSYLGRTPFEIRGKGFPDAMEVLFPRQTLAGDDVEVSEDGTRIRGIVPAARLFPEEPVTSVAVRDPKTRQAALLEDAFTYIGPLAISGVEPFTLSEFRATVITITGVAFSPETRFSVYYRLPTNSVPLEDVTFLDARTVRATFPAGRTRGRHTIVATEIFDGTVISAETSVHVEPVVPEIHDVQPRVLPSAGGASVTFRGFDLFTRFQFRIGNVPLSNVVGNDEGTEITGLSPELDTGTYAADVFDPRSERVETVFEGPITVSGPPLLESIRPDRVSLDGGTLVDFHGQGLIPGTIIRIGTREVLDVRPGNVDLPTLLVGTTPPGDVPGSVDVEVSNVLGSSRLPGGLTYFIEDHAPGPQQVETSLADGTVLVRWVNPISYEQIEVYDARGNIVAQFEGDRTFFAFPAGGRDSMRLEFVGRTSPRGEPSRRVAVAVARRECDRPPPLEAIRQAIASRFEGLEYEDVEFSLYGAHSEADVVRCAGGGDGGGAAVNSFPPRAGALEPGVGYIQRPIDRIAFPESSTTTGFTLEQPARKLEIAVHGRKIAADFGVQLRGRLVHVFPDDGFEDEFTFPETVIRSESEWNVITYFRADSDIGRELEGEGDPGPLPCPSGAACGGLELPAGDYVLELYVVGGARDTAYWVISSTPAPRSS